MNRIKLENETLLEEERDLMGSLSEFACPIPEKQINYLESDFFYELKQSLSSKFLEYDQRKEKFMKK